MNQFEVYSLLFVDTLAANIVFYGTGEMILPSMLSLGGYDNKILIIVASCAYVVAFLINFWLGVMLCKIYKTSIDNESAAKNYDTLNKVFQRYGNWILCCNTMPLIGSILGVLAGFVRFNILHAVIISTVSKVIYYILL
jgi:membrane protein YqaA with SNARE-associated domain